MLFVLKLKKLNNYRVYSYNIKDTLVQKSLAVWQS